MFGSLPKDSPNIGSAAGGAVQQAVSYTHLDVYKRQEEASYMSFSGESQVRELTPGHVFELEDHTRDEFNIEYMILTVQHLSLIHI